MDKSLQEKAIDIKGKQYVLVSDRILYFNETYPNGSITTELVSEPDAKMVVIKATVTPDVDKLSRTFTDYSQATWGEGFINRTAAMENCSTSAVGRALAYMGIGVIDSIASVDEIHKAQSAKPFTPPDELGELKREVFNQFAAHGMDDLTIMKSFIKSATGKESIDTVVQAKLVLNALAEKAESEIE